MPDDKTLMIGGGGDGVHLWDVGTGKEMRRLPPGSVAALADDGKIMAIWEPGAVAICDTVGGTKLVDLQGEFRPPGRLLFSPDAKVLARILPRRPFAMRADTEGANEIFRWSTVTGKPLSSFRVETENITEVAFSPDGKHLGAGDGKGFIHLLDADNGKTVRKWKAHGEQVLALKYSSNGKVLASSSSDDKICLWNPASGQKLHEILPLGRPRQAKRPLGLGAVANIAFVFSPNGKTLAVCSTGRPFVRAVAPAFEMWDVASGEKIALKTPPPSGAVQDLAFSHDGRVLAGLTGSGVIALWDAATGRRLNPDTGDQNPIGQLAVFPDGKRLATRSGDTIHVWNLEGAKVEDRIVMPNLQAMALSPDGRHLAAVATFLGSVWDTKSKQVTKMTLRGRTQHHGLAYSPDGSKLVLLRILEIALVDIKTWSEVWTSDAAGSAGTGQVLFSPDGSFVATPNFQGQIILWNAANGKRLRVLGGPTRMGTGKSRALKGGRPLRQIGGYAVSADGRMVAAVTMRTPAFRSASELNLWEAATGASRGVFPVPEVQDGRAPARAGFGGFGGGGFGGGRVPGAHVAFSADSTRIAYGNRAGTITIVDLATGSPIQQLAGHTDAITCLAFSHDGRRLFSGSDDTTVLVWDLTALPKIGKTDAWQILGGDDAAAAYQAMGRLAATAAKTLPELKKRLRELTNPLTAGLALEVLERIGSAEAQRMLEEYTHDGRVTGLRDQARAACDRLQQHRKDAGRSARLIQSLRQAASDHAKDRDGNDLPPGAVARLGTKHYRFANLRPGLGTPVAAFVDDKTLAIGGSRMPIRFIDLTTGNDKRWFRAPWDFAVSANGKTLAAGPSVWDISSGKLLVESPGRRRALALSPDGKTIAVQEESRLQIGKIFLWNIETGDSRQLEGTGAGDPQSLLRLVYSARTFAFSRDGKLLAGIAVPGEIGLWETATAKLLRKWAAPGDTGSPLRIGCAVLGFSPGSELVVAHVAGTPGAAGRVLFWDPRSGKPLRRLNDDKSSIHEAALSVDGSPWVAGDVREHPGLDVRARRTGSGGPG